MHIGSFLLIIYQKIKLDLHLIFYIDEYVLDEIEIKKGKENGYAYSGIIINSFRPVG